MSSLKKLINFLNLIYANRILLLSMAKRELKERYIGSSLGVFWSFINPIVMISVYWFVFSYGFRTATIEEVSFVVWLSAGISAWFFFSDVLFTTSSVLTSYSYLIKKMSFPSQILPLIRILTALITHLVFLIIFLILLFLQNVDLAWINFQVFYYMFAMIFLLVGLGWLISSLNVVSRDVSQIVGVILQVGFWGTPIFWNIKIMPVEMHDLLKLNPMFYIVQGYRDSFIHHVPFWEHPVQTIYFWTISILFFVIGAIVFRNLKKHFVDLL